MTRASTCGRHLGGAAAAAHRVFRLVHGHLRQFAVAPHPAAIDPVLELPPRCAVGGERPARGDGMPVPGADQRQPAPLRHGAPQPLAGKRAPQIRGERRTLADGVDAGLLARMGDHCRDVAGGEDARVTGRPQGFVDRDEAVGGQRQPGFGEPGRRSRLGHPQRLVEGDRACRRRRSARRARPGRPRCSVSTRDAALGQDPLEQSADPPVVRRQQRLPGYQRNLDRAAAQGGEPMLRRERQLDTGSTAADHREAQPRHLLRPGEQRLPAARRNGRSA